MKNQIFKTTIHPDILWEFLKNNESILTIMFFQKIYIKKHYFVIQLYNLLSY